MTDYHVSCGVAGIYAGTLSQSGKTWSSKTEVTDEACGAVAQYLLEHHRSMRFEYKGKKYTLRVEEVDNEQND